MISHYDKCAPQRICIYKIISHVGGKFIFLMLTFQA